jgi:high-affinity iron transporter
VLQALLVTFREGVESFLIIGIVAAYLRKTGRERLVRGVRIGLAASVVTCLGGAWLWLQVPNQPAYEGVAALCAAVFVAALLWQAIRAGRRIRSEIEHRVELATGAADRASWRAMAGVAAVTTVLVTREGLEAIFYLGVQALALRSAADRGAAATIVAGAALGLVLAGAAAWTWTRWSRRLDLGVVLKVTALFLGLFLVQLVVYGVHELAESGIIHGSQSFHDATEAFGPDGRVGHLVSYALLAAPLVYVVWTRRNKSRAERRKWPAPAA